MVTNALLRRGPSDATVDGPGLDRPNDVAVDASTACARGSNLRAHGGRTRIDSEERLDGSKGPVREGVGDATFDPPAVIVT